jgi:hypothetical protein
VKYLLLIYQDEGQTESATQDDRAASRAEYDQFNATYGAKGVLRGGAELQPTATATSVRLRGGEALLIDGPFAETKEQLAGFYLIEARDLNDAIQVAAKIPPAREGSIEVRPVRELNP